jgi:hypothetical protein
VLDNFNKPCVIAQHGYIFEKGAERFLRHHLFPSIHRRAVKGRRVFSPPAH